MIPAMIGAGKDCESFYENLPPAGRQVLLNLVNKTTIPQLGALLKSCAVLISADTRHSPLCSRLRRSRGRCFLSE